ncbi:hypothetical protein MRX96_057276 [Rhipicephalus microplus]
MLYPPENHSCPFSLLPKTEDPSRRASYLSGDEEKRKDSARIVRKRSQKGKHHRRNTLAVRNNALLKETAPFHLSLSMSRRAAACGGDVSFAIPPPLPATLLPESFLRGADCQPSPMVLP